jgi:hypothetical protein
VPYIGQKSAVLCKYPLRGIFTKHDFCVAPCRTTAFDLIRIRVTRLGEFSPVGRLLGSFVKITEIAQIMGLLFSTVKVVY